METKVKEVTQALIDSIAEAKGMDPFIDSTDSEARAVIVPVPYVPDPERESAEVQRFTMTKWHDKPRTRGEHAEPLGHIVYTVTVEARYESFDDEAV